MSVRVVLDTSALLAYARLESLAVGELIGEVQEDDESTVGVPVGCFLAAHPLLDEAGRAHLNRMADPGTVMAMLPLAGVDVVEVAELDAAHPGLGHAIVETRRHAATLATFAGDAARLALPDDDVIDLS